MTQTKDVEAELKEDWGLGRRNGRLSWRGGRSDARRLVLSLIPSYITQDLAPSEHISFLAPSESDMVVHTKKCHVYYCPIGLVIMGCVDINRQIID